jgi:hypothetical protein
MSDSDQGSAISDEIALTILVVRVNEKTASTSVLHDLCKGIEFQNISNNEIRKLE